MKQNFSKLFFVCLLILPSVATAEQFLTNSNILKAKGIQIFVGENHDDAVVFDKDVLKKYNISKDGTNLFLITSNGLIPLKGKNVQKNLTQACGDPYPGIGFKKEGNKGFLIAKGYNINGIIKWYPAKELVKQKIPLCLKKITNIKNASFSSYTSSGLKGTIQQISWRKKLTETDFINYCKEMAEHNVNINKNMSYSNLYNDCIQQKQYCEFEDRVFVSFYDEQNQCKEVTSAIIDCDGKTATAGYDLRKFLGVLKIRSGSKEEVWLLWNAPGYEGEGIFAVEINDIGKREKPSAEWLVYTGC